jgi:hypothetical protein
MKRGTVIALVLTALVVLLVWWRPGRGANPVYPYHVSWPAVVTDMEGTPIVVDSYRVEYGLCSGGARSSVIVPGSQTFADVPLVKGNYCWQAFAQRGEQESAPSATVELHTMTDTDADGVPDFEDNCTLTPNASQIDSDADGYGNVCDGDFDGNGYTNAMDSALLRVNIGGFSPPPLYSPFDLNCNGYINAFDVALFRTLLGRPPGPSEMVP